MTLTLHVAGGSFDLAETYSFDDIVATLGSDHAGRLSFDLADGGLVTVQVAIGCDWSLETHPI